MYNINYHVVWSVKYRRKILSPEIEEYLKRLVHQIAEEKGFIVHLFVVKYLKGITGRKMFEEFPEIRRYIEHQSKSY